MFKRIYLFLVLCITTTSFAIEQDLQVVSEHEKNELILRIHHLGNAVFNLNQDLRYLGPHNVEQNISLEEILTALGNDQEAVRNYLLKRWQLVVTEVEELHGRQLARHQRPRLIRQVGVAHPEFNNNQNN